MTLTPTETRALLDRYGIEPKRSLGQNFVVDPNTIRRIVALADLRPGDRVVEIGAGLGALTRELVSVASSVTAIELDDRLAELLEAELGAEPGLQVVHADALTVDFGPLLGGVAHVVVANLPYNVSVPVVLRLLEEVPLISRLLVMVQREVAERLCAEPGSKAFGLPSLVVQYFARAELVGRVSAEVFFPRPKVESALVRVERRPGPAVDADPDRLFALARAGFGQRRKMIRNSLTELLNADAIERAGVPPTARAEELGLTEWARLAAQS